MTTLRADRLEWTGNENPIIAKGNIRITRNKDFIALADKVVIDPGYEKFKIVGNSVSKIYKE